MSRSAWRVVFVIAFAGQTAALYWPRVPGLDSGLPLDKIAHVLLFTAVAALGVLAGFPTGWLVLGLLLQGIVSEAAQGAIPGRGSDPVDLLADVIGIAAGVTLGSWLRGRRGRPSDHP